MKSKMRATMLRAHAAASTPGRMETGFSYAMGPTASAHFTPTVSHRRSHKYQTASGCAPRARKLQPLRMHQRLVRWLKRSRVRKQRRTLTKSMAFQFWHRRHLAAADLPVHATLVSVLCHGDAVVGVLRMQSEGARRTVLQLCLRGRFRGPSARACHETMVHARDWSSHIAGQRRFRRISDRSARRDEGRFAIE